jgi:hypothetical protein
MKRPPISRRIALKLLSAVPFLATRSAAAEFPLPEATRIDRWHETHDRVFLGETVWANPMEDWRVVDGWAECIVSSRNRNIHSLAHQLVDQAQPFTTSVRIRKPAGLSVDNGAGFRIGIRSRIDDYRSHCFAHGAGINAGILRDRLVIGEQSVQLEKPFDTGECLLVLNGTPLDGPQYQLELTAIAPDGTHSGHIAVIIPKARIPGNLALVSQFQYQGNPAPGGRKEEPCFAFTDWRAEGPAISNKPEQAFGVLLWTQYTLSDSRSDAGFVLKLSALTGPLGEADNPEVELHLRDGDTWKPHGTATLDKQAWIATFRIPNWNEKKETAYRVVYRERLKSGGEKLHQWTGTIKANPVGRPLRIAAMTCQNDYAFPYQPVADNIVKLDPDLLYFSGDQMYEAHGGYFVIREPAGPAILNYLRKYYQHGWAFRDVMRNAPTILITDDHDVFHGNIWGEGGIPMKGTNGATDSSAGYIQPPEMVNVVHLTHTAHHPDFFDPEPIEQGITVYYGDMVYGGVGFAILADRMWKSGPEHVDTGAGRPDHLSDPTIDTRGLDKPGLVLLGERQEKFLAKWASDWRGHTMKIVLSQSPFANLATHHGQVDNHLIADLDSCGWPQTPRNRAIDIMRPAKALHINGDQHLATLAQYGVDKQRDSSWSYCTPAIATSYQRWWRPEEVGMAHTNRPAHGLPNTGEYLEGFGNKVYVYAVGNPVPEDLKVHPYQRAQMKASGFGFVTVDTEAKTYTLDAYKFLIDATDGKPDNQYPGWPVTIHMDENAGENRLK